jgi:hypothetical protein
VVRTFGAPFRLPPVNSDVRTLLKPKGDQSVEWFKDRLAVAFVSCTLAGLTLFLYPLVLSFVASSHGGGAGLGVFKVFVVYYQLLFSKVGLILMASAGLCGFVIGPDRMATLFGFLWGTDPWWSRIAAKLEDRLSGLYVGYELPNWVAFAIVGILIVVVTAYVARSS